MTAVLAIVLIASGTVLAWWTTVRERPTVAYLVVSDTIHYGDQIQRSDLRTITLPAGSGSFISASRRDSVLGSYAHLELVPDTVLVEDMFGDVPTIAEGKAVIGLTLDTTQFPQTLMAGDHVVMVQTDASGSPVQLSDGIVHAVRPAPGESVSVIDIVMSKRCADDYAGSSSVHQVAIVQVSATARRIECAEPSAVSHGSARSP